MKLLTVAILAGATLILAAPLDALIAAQSRITAATYRAPRTADGKPDLNGIWQAMNTANWNLEPHPASQGPYEFGAMFSIPAGLGVVDGGMIPYRADMLAKKQANAANWTRLDPELKCYLPGVPRATYMPYPFQIVQTPAQIFVSYEYASAIRTIYLTDHRPAQIDSWMGTSNGRWEGETLVVDVTGLMADTWFDRAGNFHSDALHVVERYTRTGADHLTYEAVIEDANVFTRPWTIRMPLYRHLEKDAQLLEYKCVEFAEELMYGNLRKDPKAR